MVKNALRLLGAVFLLSMLSAGASSAASAAALARGSQQTTIPFELIDNRIFLSMKINGQGPFAIVLDTGASNILDNSVAQQLGLVTHDPFSVAGGGEGSANSALCDVDTMSIGDLNFANQQFIALDLSGMKNAIGFRKLDGFIGYEVLSQYVVEINYDSKTLRFTASPLFNYQGSGDIIPFGFQNTTPTIRATMDGVSGLFWIDTGDRSSMTLTTPFVAQNNFTAIYQPHFEMITGWGVAGALSTQLVRTSSVLFGHENINSAIVRFPTATSGGMTTDMAAGTLGNGILHKFNTVIDYSRQRLILERNSFYNQPDLADRSGLWLIQNADQFKILDVVNGGPAWMAGLRPGQIISAVNSQPASSIFLPDLRTQLSNPDFTSVQMTVTSPSGENSLVQIQLKQLVP